jgi:hypothetical protein
MYLYPQVNHSLNFRNLGLVLFLHFALLDTGTGVLDDTLSPLSDMIRGQPGRLCTRSYVDQFMSGRIFLSLTLVTRLSHYAIESFAEVKIKQLNCFIQTIVYSMKLERRQPSKIKSVFPSSISNFSPLSSDQNYVRPKIFQIRLLHYCS